MVKINGYENKFISIFKAKQKDFDMNEDNNAIDNLIKKGTKVLGEMAERYVPENNKFKKVFVAFDIPQKRQEALLSVSHDEISPNNLRRLAVEIHHSNSDKFYSQYLYKGTKKEVIDFINNDSNKNVMLESLKALSKKVDEDYR